ncbi:MAG: hypothetical protein JWN25_1475 [Verrucomicrobiales bacterium]|nr:hypothetical protein [Verrucomicrobiales bacterium]
MESTLTNNQLRQLKAKAQHMDASLKIGKAGFSDGFIATLKRELELHELVKVKFDEFKEEKKVLAPELAEKTGSHLVMRVGNVAVYFKQNAEAGKRKIKFVEPTPEQKS